MSVAAAAVAIQGEIDTPRPLQAREGRVEISGWCTDASGAPLEVRLVAGSTILPAGTPQSRPDLGGRHCGFMIAGTVPAGVHLARFEARRQDGSWQAFRSYTLSVTPAPLIATVEWPRRTGAIETRTRVAGWAVLPEAEIECLSLRFGHRDVPCRHGEARPDVAGLLPHLAQAGRSGWMTSERLPAGRGPLRVRARAHDGSVHLAPTPIVVAIEEDEQIERSLDLSAERVFLPAARRRSIAPARLAASPLNLLFVLPGSFAANNALHVAGLANALAAAGHACAVAVANEPETIARHAEPAFAALRHDQAPKHRFPDGRGPDVVHAWTTREGVRRAAERILANHRARLVVHLEDNEQELLAQALGRGFSELAALPPEALDRIVPPELSHPRHGRAFLARADGITLITPRLREFTPAGARCHVVWPAADPRCFFPRPRPDAFRRVLDVAPGSTILFYHGNVHASNAAEMRELYAAVARLNEEGAPVTLLRTGEDTVDFLGGDAARVRRHVLELGQILHHHHLPSLMALADIFVQPGGSDAFNDYRFPSKLPEFFALGRPVVLPRANLGLELRHRVDAYVLDRADAEGIVRSVQELRFDPVLAARLAEGAVRFASERFSWRRSAEALADFYASLTPV